MKTLELYALLWINIVIVFVTVVLVYSVLPNVWTRVFHRAVIVKGPAVKEIALTFDDGPDVDFTPDLLDVLAQHQLPATFFVLAEKALEYPDIIERMMKEGHDVQIHGWSHKLVPLLLPGTTLQQYHTTQRMLEEKFTLRPTYYRPTWGLCNLMTLMKHKPSVKLITWSIMVGDWRITAATELLRRITRKLHPGAVLVLHDSDKTPGAQYGAPRQVIALMPLLAESVRQQGYEFCLLKDWF